MNLKKSCIIVLIQFLILIDLSYCGELIGKNEPIKYFRNVKTSGNGDIEIDIDIDPPSNPGTINKPKYGKWIKKSKLILHNSKRFQSTTSGTTTVGNSEEIEGQITGRPEIEQVNSFNIDEVLDHNHNKPNFGRNNFISKHNNQVYSQQQYQYTGSNNNENYNRYNKYKYPASADSEDDEIGGGEVLDDGEYAPHQNNYYNYLYKDFPVKYEPLGDVQKYPERYYPSYGGKKHIFNQHLEPVAINQRPFLRPIIFRPHMRPLRIKAKKDPDRVDAVSTVGGTLRTYPLAVAAALSIPFFLFILPTMFLFTPIPRISVEIPSSSPGPKFPSFGMVIPRLREFITNERCQERFLCELNRITSHKTLGQVKFLQNMKSFFNGLFNHIPKSRADHVGDCSHVVCTLSIFNEHSSSIISSKANSDSDSGEKDSGRIISENLKNQQQVDSKVKEIVDGENAQKS